MTEAALAANEVALRAGAAPISNEVSGGEIVGLAGLDGHGQERFLKILAGLETAASGAVSFGESPVHGFYDAVSKGIAYLGRDRRATGIFSSLSILDNFAISTVWHDVRSGLISRRARRQRYESFKERLSVVAPDPRLSITTLSGGNQQKILLARLMAMEPQVYLLNDPTRGVDVATRHVLYGVFRELAAAGTSIVILSTEIEEILLLCDRVLVFREDTVAAEIAGAEMTNERVISVMFGEPQ